MLNILCFNEGYHRFQPQVVFLGWQVFNFGTQWKALPKPDKYLYPSAMIVQLWDPEGTTKARQTPCENTSWEKRSCVFYDTSKYPPLKHQLPTLQLEELIHFTLRVTYSSHIFRTCASLSSPSPPPQPPPSPPRPWPLLPPFSTSQNLALSSSPLSLHHRSPTFPLSRSAWISERLPLFLFIDDINVPYPHVYM